MEDGLANRREAEVPRLDDAGVDRPDRNLKDAFAFGEPPAAAGREPEAWFPLLGMVLLAAIMILLGLTIPVSLDDLLRRATEIIVG